MQSGSLLGEMLFLSDSCKSVTNLQDGVNLTVSSMVRIRNASGRALELRCRRPNQTEGGAVVVLEDGDVIDDATGSFDALAMEGEHRKALSSFTVGKDLTTRLPGC